LTLTKGPDPNLKGGVKRRVGKRTVLQPRKSVCHSRNMDRKGGHLKALVRGTGSQRCCKQGQENIKISQLSGKVVRKGKETRFQKEVQLRKGDRGGERGLLSEKGGKEDMKKEGN